MAQGEADPPLVVSSWSGRTDDTWKDVLDDRNHDLGVGAARLDDAPLYVLLFGLSAQEGFARKTEALRDAGRVRQELLAAVNRERTARKLPPLRPDAALQAAAQAYADDMLARGYYGHESPEGVVVLGRTRLAGYDASLVGENLAMGQTSVANAMAGWMASTRHRQNILNPRFVEAGFGIALGKMPDGYEVLWVQVFGRPQSR